MHSNVKNEIPKGATKSDLIHVALSLRVGKLRRVAKLVNKNGRYLKLSKQITFKTIPNHNKLNRRRFQAV